MLREKVKALGKAFAWKAHRTPPLHAEEVRGKSQFTAEEAGRVASLNRQGSAGFEGHGDVEVENAPLNDHEVRRPNRWWFSTSMNISRSAVLFGFDATCTSPLQHLESPSGRWSSTAGGSVSELMGPESLGWICLGAVLLKVKASNANF